MGCHVLFSLPVMASKPRTSPLGSSVYALSWIPEPTTTVLPMIAGGEVLLVIRESARRDA
jgi:hypothetical protein